MYITNVLYYCARFYVACDEIILLPPLPFALRTQTGHGLLILDVSASHNHSTQSVELLWTSDQLVAEISTRQHTTATTEKLLCPRRDSNPQSQQARGRVATSIGEFKLHDHKLTNKS
jgi:hypothetical protein